MKQNLPFPAVLIVGQLKEREVNKQQREEGISVHLILRCFGYEMFSFLKWETYIPVKADNSERRYFPLPSVCIWVILFRDHDCTLLLKQLSGQRLCPCLKLRNSPSKAVLEYSLRFYTETAKFWDRNTYSAFIWGQNNVLCKYWSPPVCQWLYAYWDFYFCSQMPAREWTWWDRTAVFITLDSPFVLSLLIPISSEAAVYYIPCWCN